MFDLSNGDISGKHDADAASVVVLFFSISMTWQLGYELRLITGLK